MRTLLFSAVLGLAAVPLATVPAAAQSFRLAAPTLSVDGRRVGVVGAPLAQESFGALTLDVPGSGTYRVSDRPFDGARGVGQFDGAGLYFAVDGRSVRLHSDGPILDRPGTATAFVRFDASPEPGPRGLARVALAGDEAPRRPPAPSVRPAPARPAPAQPGPTRDADGRLRSDIDRVTAERGALEADRDRLRAEIADRDRALDALRAESEDRRVRLAETDADLGTTQRALADARAVATSALSTLSPQTAAVLPRETPATEQARLSERLAAVERERDALALQVAVLQQERDALRASIDRLTADLGAVRLDVERLRQAPPVRPDETRAPTTAAQTADGGRARAYFPGFDFARLQNPDMVRRRLDEAEIPHGAADGHISGDVLVLFATDRDGRVIRTAVSSPIGGGLDGLAESLVRDMRFVPPTVSGVPTGLRSQVLVRFEP